MSERRDGPTLMVTDDIDDARFVLRTFLETNGYCVVEAKDGLEAVELAARTRPHLILMDLNMPVLDGLAAIARLRAGGGSCATVPILAFTAYDTYGIREAVFEAGGDEYMAKPLDLEHLRRVIDRLLNEPRD